MGTDPFMNPSRLNVANCSNDRIGGNVVILAQLSDGELAANKATGPHQTVLSSLSNGLQSHSQKNTSTGD